MTSPTLELPPLPEMDVGIAGQVRFAYTEDAMRAYALEVRRQALEEAAKVADEVVAPLRHDSHAPHLASHTTAWKIATAIRALK